VLTESACAFIASARASANPNNLIVVDVGEGTLDISIGCHTPSGTFEFLDHIGNTAINGFAFTAAVCKRIWLMIDANVVHEDDPKVTRRAPN